MCALTVTFELVWSNNILTSLFAESTTFNQLLIPNFLKSLILFIFSIPFLYACNNVDTKPKIINPAEIVSSSSLKDSTSIETDNLKLKKNDTLSSSNPGTLPKNNNATQIQIRTIEGVSDAKLNGEPILIQEELAKSVLNKYPDTIKHYLKAVYLNQERNFPRSISDNFEKGVSTERIHYPRLNYRVELFKDGYARNSYRTFEYSVRKENGILIVE